MRRHLILVSAALTLASCNFLENPTCTQVSPMSPRECKGHLSNCWSPGVRDTDCLGNGLCCYDGCANTCYTDQIPSPTLQQQSIIQKSPLLFLPPSNYLPMAPPSPAPPPRTTPPPPTRPPPPRTTSPTPTPPPPPRTTYPPPTRPPPARTTQPPYPVAQPSDPISKTSCPPVTPLSFEQCTGRLSTCWSVGVPDLDCPDWGLCCFDSCANVCLGSTPITQPRDDTPLFISEPPRNPCDPNPCGEGSMCIPQEGKPFCKCPEGLVPDPTPEIKCSEAVDPCKPSPCGPGTTCSVNRDGYPVCNCESGLVPKPDTITGCGPECLVDLDCRYGFVCDSQHCIERPDPCNPSPCGPGTTCTSNTNGNPVCRCLPGLIPKPDTITGCGPECTVDPDCQYGYICSQHKCVERPDPCQINPCGSGAVSTSNGDRCSCSCPPGTVGNPQTSCHQGQCLVDDDCNLDKACLRNNCEDPCLSGTCRTTDFCKVVIHNPICGYNYDPPTEEPKDLFVIGQRYIPSQPVETEHKVIVGGKYGEEIVSRQKATVTVGGEYTNNNRVMVGELWQEPVVIPDARMMMMDTSGLPVIGIGRNKKNKVLRRRARKKVYV